MRTGRADLPLHTGRAPRRPFERMTSLAREMTLAIVAEEGGQDGTPYAVDRPTDDATIQSLRTAVGEARLGRVVKTSVLKRLAGSESA